MSEGDISIDGLPPMPHKLESMEGPGQTNWVIKGRVLMGAHPYTVSTTELVRNLRDILSAGVTTFVCLQAEMPSPMVSASHPAVGGTPGVTGASGAVVTARPYFADAKIVQQHGDFPYKGPLSYVHMPIPENAGGVVSDAELVPHILNLVSFLKAGEVLYLHCSDGNGRSGTVAALLLGLAYSLSSSEALDQLQRYRQSRPGTAGSAPDTHEQKMQVHRLLGDDKLRAAVHAVESKRSIETVKIVEADVDAIHEKIRNALSRRGASTVKALGRLFKIMDDDGGKTLSPSEFYKGMHDIGAGLSKSEVELLFNFYDKNGDGEVSFDEFLLGVRGRMNERRTRLVHEAFQTLDQDGSGVIDIDDIARFYNARSHPDVLAGKKTEEEVLHTFLDTFDVKTRDRKVTIEEFEEYYSGVSASIDDDNYFQLMMWNAWPLAARKGAGGSAAGAHSTAMGARVLSGGRKQVGGGFDATGGAGGSPTQAAAPSAPISGASYVKKAVRPLKELLAELRATLAKRGARGIVGLGRSFKIMDDDRSRSLSAYEFKKAMRDVGLRASDAEINAMFASFDKDGSGTIDYEEFLANVRGRMNDKRKALVRQAFDKLDVDASGIIDVDEAKLHYEARKHPAVVAGKKTEEEVLRDFLTTFEVGTKDGNVHYDEFEAYYENVSASIDDDAYFELMMWNTWNLGGKGIRRTHKKGWSNRDTESSAKSEPTGMLASFGGASSGREPPRTGKKQLSSVVGGSLYDSKTYQSSVPWDTRGGDDPRASSGLGDETSAIRADIRAQRAARSSGGGGHGGASPAAGSRSMAGAPAGRSSGGGGGGTVSFAAGGAGGAGVRGDASRAGSRTAAPPAPAAAESSGPPKDIQALLDRVRATLRKRGARGITGLGRCFRIMDDDGSKTLNHYEFSKALHDFGLGLGPSQIDMLFSYYDKDGSGTIDFDEFMVGLRGEMNPRRKALVKQAFERLDANDTGVVDIDDVRLLYDASKNPDVIAGKRTEAEVLREFLDTFDSDAPDGRVTLEEFEKYYANISASIDDDNYFQLMIWNAWNLQKAKGSTPRFKTEGASHGRRSEFTASGDAAGASRTVTGWIADESDTAGRLTGAAVDVNVRDVIQRLRATLTRRGAKGISGLQRSFKIMDDDRSRNLSLYEFSKAMRDVGMGLSEPELRALFHHYDTDRNGTIDYEEFLKGLRGELNDTRRALVHQAFAKIDIDGSGALDFDDVKVAYSAKSNPDVANGKKTERQVLSQFLSTFDGGEKDGKITLDEFEAYYAGVSASIDDDAYFRLMMWNTWNLGEPTLKRSHKKAWGGEF